MMNNKTFLPRIRPLTDASALTLVNLSQRLTTPYLRSILQKSHASQINTDEPLSGEHPLLIVCDHLEDAEALTTENTPCARVITVDELLQTSPAHDRLRQTDWYVIREMERKLFPDGHPCRVFRDGLRGGEDVNAVD